MPAASTARLEAFAHLRERLDLRCAGRTQRPAEPAVVPTALPGVDTVLGGGLPRGALTELVFATPSSGGQLALAALLRAACRAHRVLALADAADGFDPGTIEPPPLLRHLLWVRCGGPCAGLQAIDLLARDGNFDLLVLDLRGCDSSELRRTPSAAWHRLQRVIEPTDTALVVFSPRHLVPAARARLRFSRALPLTCLSMEQQDIGKLLVPEVERARGSTRWSDADTAMAAPG
jgi:hypothetical protein